MKSLLLAQCLFLSILAPCVRTSARFLLYDVNPGEGFNLRRDVYMRVAYLARVLNTAADPWTLVLPPWGGLYHWRSRGVRRSQIPWGTFFDVASLAKYTPVVEFEQFLAHNATDSLIDQVFYLQQNKAFFETGVWEEMMEVAECSDPPPYRKNADGKYAGFFWGYDGVRARRFACVTAAGHASALAPLLRQNATGTSVFVHRAETVLHDSFGQSEYWKIRRSMRFAARLVAIGDTYRAEQLNSTDEADGTAGLAADWTQQRARREPPARGGDYLAVHLRRQDYVRSHRDSIPSLDGAAAQINRRLAKFGLRRVFLASDADLDEVIRLAKMVRGDVHYFRPEEAGLLDGEVAVVDQWVCAHARFFLGSHLSTFSFRIHEEREILGFDPDTTFNRLCADGEETCEQPSKWTLVFNDEEYWSKLKSRQAGDL